MDDISRKQPWYAEWYENPESRCPECAHGPKWHNDPSGCTRMTDGWCDCTLVWLPPTGSKEVNT